MRIECEKLYNLTVDPDEFTIIQAALDTYLDDLTERKPSGLYLISDVTRLIETIDADDY